MAFQIPLYKSFHDAQDLQVVQAVIERGMAWADGPEIGQLEQKLCQYTGRKFAVAFSSGTSALHAMLLAHGIGPGDEVVVPSFTFIATANAVLMAGAKPVFADIEKDTLALGTKSVEKKLTKKTKAIMPIHYGGCPAGQIKELRRLADEKEVLLLEDNAESLGASLDGHKAGTFGQSVLLSFCANKLITCGEGGAVLTDAPEIFQKMRLLRSHGRAEGDYFGSTKSMDYVQLGYNYRMPSMNAALAGAQMDKIEKLIRERRAAARQYREQLAAPGLSFLPDDGKRYNVYQLFTILLKDRKVRDGLQAHLEKAGIQSKVYFEPAHLTHFYKNKMKYGDDLPVTQEMAGRALSLPMFVGLSEGEIEQVTGQVRAYLKTRA